MTPCWERLQICWKTDLVFKTSLIIWESLGRKKGWNSKKTCKILQLLRKNQLFKCCRQEQDWLHGSYGVSIGRQDVNSQGKQAQNEHKTATSLSRLHHWRSLREGQMLVKNGRQGYPCCQIQEWTRRHPNASFSPVFWLFSDIIFDKKETFTVCFRLVGLWTCNPFKTDLVLWWWEVTRKLTSAFGSLFQKLCSLISKSLSPILYLRGFKSSFSPDLTASEW